MGEKTESLTSQVLDLTRAVLAEIPDGANADLIREVERKLGEPLRVAVAGRLKAGKSTLVNALLRQRVAPVDVGECTKVVTWFRYGHQERAEVEPRGDVPGWTVSLTAEGQLPRSIGADPATIESVTVWLSNEALRSLTIIDTPGLDSLDATSSSATEELLALGEASRAALAQADALIFLLPSLTKGDEERLIAFRSLFIGSGLSALSTLGVLSKVDKLTEADGDDPMVTAREIAARCRSALGSTVSNVLPLIGLLAETADADVFTGADAHALRRLADCEPDTLEMCLLSADWFLDSDDLPLSRADRERLLTILDLYGLRRAVDMVRAGHSEPSTLVAELRRRSGIEDLRRLLDQHFARRADALKAHAALSDLERISYLPGDDREGRPLRDLREEIERVRADPAMHQLQELEALRLWSAGEVSLPPELDAELQRLTIEDEPPARLGLASDATNDDCAKRALQRAAVWLAFQNDARTDRRSERVASIMRESLMILWARCDGQRSDA